MNIIGLDHFVLTVIDIDETVEFYTTVLGFKLEKFISGGVERTSLKFGQHKINLHQVGNEFKPGADRALSGTGDLCFIADKPVEDIARDLERLGVEVLLGPVGRTGATGYLRSIYIRDPDKNLIEISNPIV
jgi:catechol 2,3-dioxygenase-like lactoylglutathione lyase family enzyme